MEKIRNLIGIIIIGLSIIGIGVVGWVIVKNGGTDEAQYVYSSLLPLVGTWVGVVLAFYFGKENYEAASKRYEKIIDKLTPDLLDDIKVSQIMITRKTMVSKEWKDLKDQTVADTIKFLLEINKSRLIVMNGDSAKYIIHASLLTKPKGGGEHHFQMANTEMSMSAFAEANIQDLENFIEVVDDEILENVRQKLNDKPNCQDVFVKDKNGHVVGWLTNTLILRYINSNNL